MKIAVVAANGRSGKAFVTAALAAGHSVRAGFRTNSTLPQHPNLTVVHCDALDEAELLNLIEEQEAVISFIGHVRGSSSSVQTDATQAIISLMETLNMKRFVSLTGTGVRFRGDTITFIDRLLNFAVDRVDPSRINDGRRHVEILRESDLDWTILRVLKLYNGQLHPYHLTAHGPAKLWVSRSTVAAAALEVLEKHTYVKEAPIIAPPLQRQRSS